MKEYRIELPVPEGQETFLGLIRAHDINEAKEIFFLSLDQYIIVEERGEQHDP